MRCDKMDSPSVSTRIEDRLGVAGQGEAGPGRSEAWQGKDHGLAGQGAAWLGAAGREHGMERGEAWRGLARLGGARPGKA